jgi:uncharacterized protein
MPLTLGLFFLLGLVLLANLLAEQENGAGRRLFHGLLFAVNLPVLLFGFALGLAPEELLAEMGAASGLLFIDWRAAGWSFVGMGLWGTAVSLRPVRALATRWMPLKVDSPVHTLALVFSGYLAGNTIFSLTQGGLEEMAATAVSASILDILFIQGTFAALAILGVGLYTRRAPQAVRQRLGLVRPTRQQLLIGVGWIIILVILQSIGGALWSMMDSSQSELVESLNQELLGDMDTFAEWLILAAATGFGEEVLFRGALQPVLGLGFTSFLFALAHTQYGITPVTVIILLIGIILGYIRRRYNTSVAIFVHAGYNFTLGMFALLALQYGDLLGG